MFDANYLSTPAPGLGLLGWLFFAAQLAFALGGLYILYVRTDTNAIRKGIWRQLGIVLVILGVVGLLVAVLRLSDVPFFNQRLMILITGIIELGVGAYILYYSRTTYPRLIATSQTIRKTSPVRRAGSSNSPRAASNTGAPNGGTPTPTTPRPVGTSSRREARRAHKRKTK
jgi:hypothetical protein